MSLKEQALIGQYSTEPLECANKWVKLFNDHHTFRGDRKKALKGIFKLRRLKSSYKLRGALPDHKKIIHHCSVCGKEGHKKVINTYALAKKIILLRIICLMI